MSYSGVISVHVQGGGGMNYDIFVPEGFNTTIHRYKALPNAPWEMLSVKATTYCIPY